MARTAAAYRQRWMLWLIWSAALLLADQFSKMLIMREYALGQGLVINDFFNLVRVHNSGAAFSFLAQASGWQRWVFIGLGVGAAVFIVWLLRAHAQQKLFAFALATLLGGAVGNVLDRLLHGHVIDFLDFHWGGWHFPVFNLADSAITLGAACLVLDELLRVRKSRR
jgi:signal peptidase II